MNIRAHQSLCTYVCVSIAPHVSSCIIRNVKTGEKQWDIPHEAKYALSAAVGRLAEKMLSLPELDELKRRFMLLDLDSSAQINAPEWRLVFKKLGESPDMFIDPEPSVAKQLTLWLAVLDPT